MKNTIRTLTILFNTEILPYEIPLFRGAILNLLGDDMDVLFHNHLDKGYRYSYPLIQYKQIQRNAAIVCVNEGTDIIGRILTKKIVRVKIGDRETCLELKHIFSQKFRVQIWNMNFKYRIRRWLPLNKVNFEKYKLLDTVSERIDMLEKILIANLLSFTKGIGLWLESEVECKISFISIPYKIKYKNINMVAFDVDFKTNLSLPNGIGIGKNASLGYGILMKIYKGKYE